ncbi:MAG TPA: hypothetical protein VKS81_04010, partial [Bacteroidota bacterium]|nr:hypothetical protein [Bacteroidota bacterium]
MKPKIHPPFRGKKPARRDARTLAFKNYLAADKLPPLPRATNYSRKVKHWQVMESNAIGDCTVAAAGNLIIQWTTNAGKQFVPPDNAIIKVYSKLSGYIPGKKSTDRGVLELKLLNYWRTCGIAGHRIQSYVKINPKNHDHIKYSIFLFGGCYVGLCIPNGIYNRTLKWSLPRGGARGKAAPNPKTGHAVPVVDYNARGLLAVSWGAIVHMTWDFFDAYCDEAYAVLSPDWLRKTRKSPNG